MRTTAVLAAIIGATVVSPAARAQGTFERAEANAEIMAKCTAEVRKQLPDPETFSLNRRDSQAPDTINGTWSWMFAFDAATKKGGQGHYNGFCTQDKDGTVSVVIA